MTITVLLFVIAAYLSFAVLLLVNSIGKPRRPTTPRQAVLGIVIFGLIVVVIFVAAMERLHA